MVTTHVCYIAEESFLWRIGTRLCYKATPHLELIKEKNNNLLTRIIYGLFFSLTVILGMFSWGGKSGSTIDVAECTYFPSWKGQNSFDKQYHYC